MLLEGDGTGESVAYPLEITTVTNLSSFETGEALDLENSDDTRIEGVIG